MSYLLEIRVSGFPQGYIKRVKANIDRKFGIIGNRRHKFVPHITVVPPITLFLFRRRYIKKMEKIIFSYSNDIHETGQLIRTGKPMLFDTAEGNKVLAIEIKPSHTLRDIKNKLETEINSGWFSKCITHPEEIWHCTLCIAKKPYDKQQIKKMYRYLQKNPPQRMKFILDRITLLNNTMILKEFDLINKKTLGRRESLDREMRRDDYVKLKEELKKKGEHFEY